MEPQLSVNKKPHQFLDSLLLCGEGGRGVHIGTPRPVICELGLSPGMGLRDAENQHEAVGWLLAGGSLLSPGK